MACKYFLLMITVKIILDKRSVKKDGTSPLKLRLLYNRKSNQVSLGYSILSKDWDAKKERIKSSCQSVDNVNRINAICLKKKQKAFDILTQLDADGKLDVLSFKEIKTYITNQHTGLMTLAFGEEIIDQLKQANKFGNARVYDTMIRSLRTYSKGKDFPMKRINYAWLKKYETWYIGKGNSYNGLSVNLRTLRALFNKAIKLKKIAKDYYPFNDYQIKNQSTRKRAISQDDLKKLKAFQPTTSRQKRAKDYFFISFYLMGASFADIAFLKSSNLIQGRIEYKRRKTGRLHNIPISEQLQEILDRHLADKDKDDFILDIIKSDDPQKQVVNVRDELRRYNKTLKEIGKLCEIEAPLTSYVARHSYATIAKRKGVPTAIISEALGHETEQITQVYLDSFENEVIDKYHQIIIGE